MNTQKIQQSISSAFASMVPADGFERITERLESVPQETRGGITMKTKAISNIRKFVLPAVAACIILAVGVCGGIYYSDNLRIDSIIDIDVNPGIEISTNKHDRVLDVTAVNNDGADILDDMDLKKTDLKVAVNAIIGSMVQKGYVVDETSSILVTVQNKNTEKAEKLRVEVLQDINDSLGQYNVNAPVMNQTLTSFDAAEQFAVENGISYGKAVFVLNLAEKDPSLKAEDLAKMTIKEITSLIVENKTDIRDIVDYDADDSIWENIADTIEDVNEDKYDDDGHTTVGTTVDKTNTAPTAAAGVITADKAKSLALTHAGITADGTVFEKAELDEDDGVLKYELEFKKNGIEYECNVDAKTGKVVSFEKDRDDDAPAKTTAKTAAKTTAGIITADKAKSLALAHAGITADGTVFEKVELDEDDGMLKYELEFRNGNVEYECNIHARTGKVLDFEKDIDDDRAPVKTTAKVTTKTTAGIITADKAKSLALTHAGITAEGTVFEKAELDEDDGVLKYELEFKNGNVEYEYNIHAKTGNILDFEKDIDD